MTLTERQRAVAMIADVLMEDGYAEAAAVKAAYAIVNAPEVKHTSQSAT